MNTSLVTRIEELLRTGAVLIPEGGSEASGYNAKRQSRYLLWRKNCLDAVACLKDEGPALSARITGNEDGMYFYHSSAEHIAAVMKDALAAAHAEAAAAEAKAREEQQARLQAEAKAREEEEARIQAEARAREEENARLQAEAKAREMEETAVRMSITTEDGILHSDGQAINDRELILDIEGIELARRETEARALEQKMSEAEAREEARKQIEALEAIRHKQSADQARETEALAQARKEADAAAEGHAEHIASPQAPRIVIFTLANHVMLKQLLGYFRELSLEPVLQTHTNGIWSGLEAPRDGTPDIGVFLLSDRYHGQELMALGYMAGRFPSTKLCCIHAHTMALGELLPNVSKREFTVSLDEIKIGLIKDLKDAGCSVSL